MEKLVLIDGHSILNRAFYGVPNLTNSEGLHTNAVYGFLNILFKVLDEEKADYLAVAFDLKAPSDIRCSTPTREQENRCRRSFTSRYRL